LTQLDLGAAAALVTEEAILASDTAPVIAWLESQAVWSDFPFILLAAKRLTARTSAFVQQTVRLLGNVVVLERPISADTLASAVDSALRARRRQYQARRDILERQQAQDRLRLALDAGRLGSWELDLSSWQLSASATCKANFGRRALDAFSYEDLLAAVHPEDRERHLDTVSRAIAQGSELDIEYRSVWSDASEHWVHVRGQAIGAEGGTLRLAGVSLDITDRRNAQSELHASQDALRQLNESLESRIVARTSELSTANDRLVKEIAERERAQAALVQAQKMEAVGQLTGGIAHDFNNLLTAIVGNVDMIGRRTADERIKRLAGFAHEAANRASRLTGQLLAFSRSQRLDLKAVDVDRLIEGMGDLVTRSIGPAIEVRMELHAGAALAVADVNQLELAILNLVINARDAMPDGGALTISAAVRAHHGSGLEPGLYVVIGIADTGEGIAPHLIEKVFEPFFTTKPVGKGTGLGLSQVYGIAKQSGGIARIESQPGQGTSVQIWLPLAHTDAEDGAHFADEHPLVNTVRDERILLIEDDMDVRRFMSECLDSLGYHVVAAGDGRAGLEMLSKHDFELLIVDFAMPGLNGAQVADEVRRRSLDMPIVFVTGYADMAAIERVRGSKFVLRKPFEVAGLANVVRDALCATRSLNRNSDFGAQSANTLAP
jgi:PAS domain S-box-containing protein